MICTLNILLYPNPCHTPLGIILLLFFLPPFPSLVTIILFYQCLPYLSLIAPPSTSFHPFIPSLLYSSVIEQRPLPFHPYTALRLCIPRGSMPGREMFILSGSPSSFLIEHIIVKEEPRGSFPGSVLLARQVVRNDVGSSY